MTPWRATQGQVTATELYRAAAAHAAAHVVYTREPISAESLNPWQMAVIGLMEDARVEALAVARFPGLRPLWASLHTTSATQCATAGDWLNRLARALLDPDQRDDHAWIAQGRALLADALPRIQAHPFDNTVSWDMGVALAHSYRELTQGPAFQPRTDGQAAAYRDDNRYFWAFAGFDAERAIAAGYEPPQQVRRQVNLMEFANEIDVETAGDDAQEIWVLGTELFPYEDMGISFNESEGREPLIAPSHYPEWDHMIQLERPAWVTVQERRPTSGDAGVIDGILTEHRRLIGRMKYILDAMQPQGVQRLRKLEDGDELDLNAALASVDRHAHGAPARPAHHDAQRAQDARYFGAGAAGPVALDQRKSRRSASRPCSTSPARPARCWPTRSTRWATRLPFTASAPMAGTM